MLSKPQFEQLPMFMTVRELSKHELGDTYLTGESNEEIMHRKLQESNKSGLTENIRQHGIQKPIHLYHEVGNTKTITDGHHRLAVARTMRSEEHTSELQSH